MKNIAFPMLLLSAATATPSTGGGRTASKNKAQAPVAPVAPVVPEVPETPVAETPVEVATKTKKVQHTVTTFEKDKDFLMDLCKEFYGPQASNPDEKRFLSTAEGFHVLLTVATDHRTGKRQAMEVNAEGVSIPVFDTDGNPEMETYDRFEEVANKVIEARGISRTVSRVSDLEAQIAALKAKLAARNGATAPATA